MSETPSVMTVKRGTGAGCLLLMTLPSPRLTELEQTQLLSVSFRLVKMVRRQFGAPLVQSKFLTGDLEAASDHPGHRASPLHPRSPLRVVIAAAAHVADQREDMAIAVGIVCHQPFTEQVTHFQRQPQQDVTCFLCAGMRGRIEDALDFRIVERGDDGS